MNKLPDYGSPSVTQTDQAEVMRQLGTLEERTTMLHKLLDDLEVRLAPILSPDQNGDAQEKGAPRPPMSAVANRLLDRNEDLRHASDQLIGLTRRLTFPMTRYSMSLPA